MKTSNKRFFNMVEVTLALGVAVVGVACVMALLPVGLNASRDAVADNYLPDVAQVMLNSIKAVCLADEKWFDPVSGKDVGYMNTIPVKDDVAVPEGFDTDFDRADPPSGYHVFMGDGFDNAGSLIVSKNGASGVFLVLQQSEVDGVFVTDFSAMARVWKTDLNHLDFAKVKSAFPMNRIGRTIMVELSWPADMSYARRKELGNIRTYQMDLFNPEVDL